MVSSVVALLVCALSVSLIPTAWADSCQSYTSPDGRYHPYETCFFTKFCCGTCTNRYCCDSEARKISKEVQKLCPDWPYIDKKVKVIVIIGSILGTVIPILICVGLIVCFVAPCCFLHKKCKKRRQQEQITVTTAVSSPPPPPPQQPVPPHGFSVAYPGYQPVPVHPGPGALHSPVAPPPYVGPYGATQPSSPSQAGGPPLNELSQPPYNPAYWHTPEMDIEETRFPS